MGFIDQLILETQRDFISSENMNIKIRLKKSKTPWKFNDFDEFPIQHMSFYFCPTSSTRGWISNSPNHFSSASAAKSKWSIPFITPGLWAHHLWIQFCNASPPILNGLWSHFPQNCIFVRNQSNIVNTRAWFVMKQKPNPLSAILKTNWCECRSFFFLLRNSPTKHDTPLHVGIIHTESHKFHLNKHFWLVFNFYKSFGG